MSHHHPALALAYAHANGRFHAPSAVRFKARYTSQLQEGRDVHQVELHDGILTVNGGRIIDPKFTKDGVRWSEKTASSYSAGSLHVMGAGAMLAGFIATGADEQSAQIAHVSLEPDRLTYTTQVCRDPKAQPQKWEPGPTISIGVHIPGDGNLPYASARIDDPSIPIDDPEDDSHTLRVAVLPPKDNEITVSLNLGLEDYKQWQYADVKYAVPSDATVAIAFDGESFTGTMKAFDAPAGAQYAWRGTIVAAVKPIPLAQLAGWEPLLDTPLSLIDLLSQSTAGASDIAKQRFQDFIVYAMSDDWRDKLFSIPKPNLDATNLGVLNAHLPVFAGQLSHAFITQQLSDITKDRGGPSNPVSDGDKDKLKYFWKRTVATLDGYNDVSARLTQISWEEVNPRIKTYADDTTTPWAKQLFAALTTKHALDQAVLSFIGSGFALTQINRNTEILLALSPSMTETFGSADNALPCTLATHYHTKVINKLAESLNTRVQLGAEDLESGLKLFLPDWLDRVNAEIANNLKNPNLGTGQKAMLNDLQNALAEEQRKAGNSVALANQLAEEISSQASSNLFGKIQQWTKTSKVALGVSKLIAIGAFVYGLQSVVGAFKGWDSLTEAAKARTVISTGELAIDLLNLIADAPLAGVMGRLVNVSETFDGLGEAIGESLAADLAPGEDFFSHTMRWAEPELDGPIDLESSFSKLFKTGSKFMQGFAVITAAAAVGFAAYQVYEDFDGKSTTAQKVIDILILTSNVVVLASTIAAFTIGECLLASIGPFGAVAGLILMIVLMFQSPPEPERPADDYMKEDGNGFLAGLKTPEMDWDKPKNAPAIAQAA
jgi:hypothetical protein